jgi:hypothetical protein
MKLIPSFRSDNKLSHEEGDSWRDSLSDNTRNACRALEEFLASESMNVIELKGDWGVGKTHFFQNFLSWARQDNRLQRFRAYSYVSLFAQASLSSLEAAIFGSHEPLQASSGSRLASVFKSVKALADQASQSTLTLGSASVAIGTASGLIDGLIRKHYIKDFLICFDDLERMDPRISPSAFLGIVSSLKEQQNCKVVLIYNREKLASGNRRFQKAIEEYREKIIDREISLRPTAAENLAVAWPQEMARPLPFEHVFLTSGCANIRVMRKARWAADYFSRLLGDQWPHIHESFQLAIATLAIIYYSRKDLFPDPSSILADDFFKHLAAESQMHRAQYEFIRKLGYSPAPHHTIILDFFRHGSVDIECYKGILQANDINERLARFNHECDEILSQFSSGFFVPHDHIVQELHEFLQMHSGDISLGKAHGAFEFLKQCGVEVDSAVLERAIQSHMELEPELDPYSLAFTELPDVVREDIKIRYEAMGSAQSISRLMQSLAGGNGWDPDEVRLLRGRSESEWLEWISSFNASKETTESGEFYSDVFHLVATFLNRFGSVADAEDQATLAKIKKALEQLRTRSPVDNLRVEMLFNYMSQHA